MPSFLSTSLTFVDMPTSRRPSVALFLALGALQRRSGRSDRKKRRAQIGSHVQPTRASAHPFLVVASLSRPFGSFPAKLQEENRRGPSTAAIGNMDLTSARTKKRPREGPRIEAWRRLHLGGFSLCINNRLRQLGQQSVGFLFLS
jgi:hypothetical protein